MYCLRHEFLAGTRLSKQQNGGFRRSYPRNHFQHMLKGGRPSNQSLRIRESAGNGDGFHLFDEICDCAIVIADWRQFDINVGLTLRCLVQVQYSLPLS